MTSLIPSTLSYGSAAVLPLGLCTASCGIFLKDQLALQHPSGSPKPIGKTLLFWGGVTSVGSNAIQLAIAAGCEVITTDSTRYSDHVKKPGAGQVFDYNSKNISDDLIRAFEGKTTAGAFSIGHGAAEVCLDILDKCKGDKFISTASYPVPQTPPKHFVFLSIALYHGSSIVFIWFRSRARDTRTKFIFGTTLVESGVGKAVYVDFLPKVPAEGTYIADPDQHIVGEGLEYIQASFDLQKKGMSGKKLVVSL
ncbi:hypothetical protein MMC28_008625 [Mycoblastus sanguinarius]|nr:hypothetical protein [Mycoblastus sanguinarius]